MIIQKSKLFNTDKNYKGKLDRLKETLKLSMFVNETRTKIYLNAHGYNIDSIKDVNAVAEKMIKDGYSLRGLYNDVRITSQDLLNAKQRGLKIIK